MYGSFIVEWQMGLELGNHGCNSTLQPVVVVVLRLAVTTTYFWPAMQGPDGKASECGRNTRPVRPGGFNRAEGHSCAPGMDTTLGAHP
jgi:hypothetical protein